MNISVSAVEADICSLPLVKGPCEALGFSWGFDNKLNKCRKFEYGGCDGNANSFRYVWTLLAGSFLKISMEITSLFDRSGWSAKRVIIYFVWKNIFFVAASLLMVSVCCQHHQRICRIGHHVMQLLPSQQLLFVNLGWFQLLNEESMIKIWLSLYNNH